MTQKSVLQSREEQVTQMIWGWWQQPHSLQGYRAVICLVTHALLFRHPIESIQFHHEVTNSKRDQRRVWGERGEERNRKGERGMGEGAEGG